MFRISRCKTLRVIASNADSGSSNSNTFGFIASVRASDTRCRIPPDNSCGRRWAACDSPTISMNFSTCSDRCDRDQSLNTASTDNAMFPRTVNHGSNE